MTKEKPEDAAAETKRIEALFGPYAGGHIDLPTADANQAIADGWARDPYAEPDPDAKPIEWTDELHASVNAAAAKAARKIRGEPEPEGEDASAKAGAGYDTEQENAARDPSAPRRGRPPKSPAPAEQPSNDGAAAAGSTGEE